jgi:tripartite-type tricarboxylate transporter receptor subunit TctC
MRILHSLISAIAVVSCLGTASVSAQAPSFPGKPVRVVVPFPAGSQADMVARIIGSKLTDSWKQPIVIENRPGAGGVVGSNLVAKATPDGHTVLLTSSSFVISAAMHQDLPYVPLRDFAGVMQLGYTTTVLVVTPSLGIKTIREFIGHAQGNPGKLIWGSAGVGTSTHMSGEVINMAAGIKAKHVGFRGAPEFLVEIVSGRIHYAAAGLGPALPSIKDGRVLALAVSTPRRSPQLPDVPTLAEVFPGYEKDGSYMMLAPARTPRPALARISSDVGRVLEHPEISQKLHAFGFVPAPTTPEESDRLLRTQIDTFSKVMRVAGLRSP